MGMMWKMEQGVDKYIFIIFFPFTKMNTWSNSGGWKIEIQMAFVLSWHLEKKSAPYSLNEKVLSWLESWLKVGNKGLVIVWQL